MRPGDLIADPIVHPSQGSHIIVDSSDDDDDNDNDDTQQVLVAHLNSFAYRQQSAKGLARSTAGIYRTKPRDKVSAQMSRIGDAYAHHV